MWPLGRSGSIARDEAETGGPGSTYPPAHPKLTRVVLFLSLKLWARWQDPETGCGVPLRMEYKALLMDDASRPFSMREVPGMF